MCGQLADGNLTLGIRNQILMELQSAQAGGTRVTHVVLHFEAGNDSDEDEDEIFNYELPRKVMLSKDLKRTHGATSMRGSASMIRKIDRGPRGCKEPLIAYRHFEMRQEVAHGVLYTFNLQDDRGTLSLSTYRARLAEPTFTPERYRAVESDG